MKLVKSLLLGTAAGFVAVAGANAADLPSRKAAPVEYVRVCSEYGKGFFYIPGSDTCIQISGRVRADTMYIQTNNRNNDSFTFGVNTRLNLDVRTNTPYGTVRAYLRYGATRGNNNYGAEFGKNGTGSSGGSAGLDQAYIQFAGFTAGRLQSFYDFYANNDNFAPIRSSDTYNTTLAYTATFGNGFSATIGIEDGAQRRVEDNRWGYWSDGSYTYRADGYSSAGQSVPDVIGVLRVDQSWGSAQLSAALHQIRPAYFSRSFNIGNNPVANLYGPGDFSNKDTDYGFAVLGGVKLNLPMIAPGDALWIEGAYSEGALAYIGANSYSYYQGGVNVPITDAFIDSNGRLKKAKGWSAMVNFTHYWTPSIRQNLFASYMKIDYSKGGYDTVYSDVYGSYNSGFLDTTELRVGSNVIWSPIKNFDIGVEVLYTRLDPKGRVLSENNGYAKTISSDDSWQGRLRVQRDF